MTQLATDQRPVASESAHAIEPGRVRFVRDHATWLSYLSLGYLIFVESSLGPAMPSLRADLGLSYTEASLHFTAIAGGAVTAAWFGPQIARRYGRKRAFWAGIGGMLLGTLFIVASPVVVGTIAGATLLGLLGALMSVVIQAAMADQHGAQRAVALAELNMSASTGAILAAIAVGAFEQTRFGWRGAEIAVAALFVVFAALFARADFSGGIPPVAGRSAARGRLPRAFWVCCAIGMLSAGSEWSFAYWGADFMDKVIGFSKPGAAAAMSCFFVAMAGGRLAGARIARVIPSADFVVGSFGLAAAGFPIFWLSGVPAVALVGLFMVGLGIANVYPLIAAIATGLAPGQSDIAISRLLFTGSFAVLAAPFALGVLGDSVGIEAAFGVIAPLLLASVVLSISLRRTLAAEAHGHG